MPEVDVVPMNSLSLSAAQRVTEAALAAARSQNIAVCITVCDPTGEPIVNVRMDGAPRLSAGVAANKAYTVASFKGMPTNQWWQAIADEPALVHGLTHTPRLIVFAGGVPVRIGGELVGAIGVSGGSASQDQEIAETAAASLGAP